MSGPFVYSEKPIRVDSGQGVSLYDDDGNEYADWGASYACVPLGHSHPAVTEAVQDQAAELTFVQASYPTDVRDRAYDTLAGAAPDGLDNVWLCNSGTEANEAALKFARSATGDSKIIATTRAFHGRTMGALATTWKSEYREPYEPLIGDVEFVTYGDSEELREAVDDETAAVILEPIQGEGGINPAPAGYLADAREVTEKTGSALVFDEVQTGMGRTGTLWACEASGVTPDILTSAKGIANGLPAGATLCADWVAENAGPHGSTFSGGPVISAAIDATVTTVLGENLPEHAADLGGTLAGMVEDRLGDEIRDVRGEGLMVGIQVKRGANRMLRDLALDHGILALPAGRTVVRLLPPLVVDERDAEELVDALAAIVLDEDESDTGDEREDGT